MTRSLLLLLVLLALPTAVFAGEFYPLTQIPGIEKAAQSSTLPEFLNTVYQLCIGTAAVLAVLQIMRGGLSYMFGDSVTEKKEARSLIVMSIVGLILVLSPAIVFGLIDPRILNLRVDFTQLQPTPQTPPTPLTPEQIEEALESVGVESFDGYEFTVTANKFVAILGVNDTRATAAQCQGPLTVAELESRGCPTSCQAFIVGQFDEQLHCEQWVEGVQSLRVLVPPPSTSVPDNWWENLGDGQAPGRVCGTGCTLIRPYPGGAALCGRAPSDGRIRLTILPSNAQGMCAP